MTTHRKRCYFQNCGAEATSAEHIPPKAFFLPDRRVQLMTVPSCPLHNNHKSTDDLYVLAQVLLNVSPLGRAREIFLKRIKPQLDHAGGAFRRTLMNGAVDVPGGARKYRVDMARMNNFFDGLCCGIAFKISGAPLPRDFDFHHVFHNFSSDPKDSELEELERSVLDFYAGDPPEVLKFGQAGTHSKDVYEVKVFGEPNYLTSITMVHEFYESFKVTSFLTRTFDGNGIGVAPRANV